MKKLLHAVALASLLALPCAGAEETVPPPGRQVRLCAAAGRDVSITLPANPTTGYDWQLLSGHDESVLFFSGCTVLASAASRRSTGAPIKERWSFTAKKRGTTVLRLVYKRSWEMEVISTMTYVVTVK